MLAVETPTQEQGIEWPTGCRYLELWAFHAFPAEFEDRDQLRSRMEVS